jgi:hypothetical protein
MRGAGKRHGSRATRRDGGLAPCRPCGGDEGRRASEEGGEHVLVVCTESCFLGKRKRYIPISDVASVGISSGFFDRGCGLEKLVLCTRKDSGHPSVIRLGPCRHDGDLVRRVVEMVTTHGRDDDFV